MDAGNNPPKIVWDVVLLNQARDKKTIDSAYINAAGEFALDAFLSTLDFTEYENLDTDEERLAYLQYVDVIDLYMALQTLEKELAAAKLETYFLTDFLEKNDPKLLVGLKQRRASAAAVNMKRATLTAGAMRRSLKSTTASIFTVVSSAQKKDRTELQVNYRTRAELAERTTLDVERKTREHEGKMLQVIKTLSAKIEELKMRHNEVEETGNNFRMHFLRDEQDQFFLDTASEKQIERKFRKFVTSWLRNARAMISTIRLRIQVLHTQYKKLQNDLVTRSELAGTICAVDFDQLTIQRQQLTDSLEKKRFNMQTIKGVTGFTSLSMGEEKALMMNMEERSKQIRNNTMEVMKQIAKLEKAAYAMHVELTEENRELKKLRSKIQRYSAPSVDDYITKQNELNQLEKEEKVLKRKIKIFGMKLMKLMKAHDEN